MTPRTFSRPVALQHRDFRLLWVGQLVSVTGSQMQLIAVNWHVYDLLRDTGLTLHLLGREVELGAEALGLGVLGLVRLFPILIFGLLGGMLADSTDRRRLMILSQTAAALVAGLLAALTLADQINIGRIYLLTAAGAAAATFGSPANQSLVPNLVPRKHLTNAISLNALARQVATVSGPALAGVLVGATDVGMVYAINALSFVAVIVALLGMRHRRGRNVETVRVGWRTLVEGMRFTYGSRIIWSTMLLDFFATFFGSARTLLPLVAGEVLHVGVEGYGLLATAQPVGSLLAGSILSLRREIHRQGQVLLISVAVYGVATALFGLSTLFALSYVFFALTGAGDTVSTVIRNTIRQLMTPDHLRGRMTGVNMIFFMGGPQLGELEAGLLAAFLGTPFAIVSGGVATVLLTGWVTWKYPRLRRFIYEETTQAFA